MGNYISSESHKHEDDNIVKEKEGNDGEIHLRDVVIDMGDGGTPWDIDQQKFTMISQDTNHAQISAKQLLLDSDDSYFDSSSEYNDTDYEPEDGTQEEMELLILDGQEEEKEEKKYDFENRPDLRYILYLKKWIEIDCRRGDARDTILERIEYDLESDKEISYHDFIVNYADVERSPDVFPLAKTAYTICRTNFLTRQTSKLLAKK